MAAPKQPETEVWHAGGLELADDPHGAGPHIEGQETGVAVHEPEELAQPPAVPLDTEACDWALCESFTGPVE